MAAPHTANPVDIHVGARVRLRRKMQGYSQSELAEALGLTFQQVQKYERGGNRISASKLYEIARFLNVPIAYFFEGYSQGVSESDATPSESVSNFLYTSEGIELAVAFPRIPRANQRRTILNLVLSMANDGG